MNPDTSARERLRCRRGIALPVALVGLLIVAVLVTTIVVTASTEAAASMAQQDATRSIYLAQTGVEHFVATTGTRNQPLATGTQTFATPDGPVRLTVQHLLTRVRQTGVIDSTYSVTAEPVRVAGARSVAAMFTRTFTPVPPTTLSANVPSGLVLGANTDIRGNANVSLGPSGQLGSCGKTQADTKVTMASDAQVTLNGAAASNIGTDTTRAWWNKQQMVQQVLGVESLESLVPRADISFGIDGSAAPLREASFIESRKTQSPNSHAAYDWGCPQGLVNCGSTAKKQWMPVVVINAKGGTVNINQDYGQGLLVVLNGDVHLNAGYSFKGILAVEGVVNLNGNIHIEGAVLAQGVVTDGSSQFGTINGTQDIYFNRCVIDDVVNNFNNPPPGAVVPPPPAAHLSVSQTFNWWEVVR